MGQTLKKSDSGRNGDKSEEICLMIDRCYASYFVNPKDWTSADFYRAVCETVEELNKKLGSTQLSVPKITTLQLAFQKHYEAPKEELTKEEFQEILQEVIIESGFTGIGVKDILMYIFGVPVTALMIKQGIGPKMIPNDLFIPAVTSATVFFLAKLQKI